MLRSAAARWASLPKASTSSKRLLHATPASFRRPGSIGFDSSTVPQQQEQSNLKSQTTATSDPAFPPYHQRYAKVTTVRGKRTQLKPEVRTARFDQLLAFVRQRVGRHPQVMTPPRKSSLVHLVQLATSQEQLAAVAEVFPKWHDAGFDLDNDLAELFARRCEELACPQLSLDVFGNLAKYSLRLNLPAARQLLHSTYRHDSVQSTMAAAALFNAHGLAAPTKDAVCTALLVRACYSHGLKGAVAAEGEQEPVKRQQEALTVARSLTGTLKGILEQTGKYALVGSKPPKDAAATPSKAKGTSDKTVARKEEKPRNENRANRTTKWLRETLANLERDVEKDPKRDEKALKWISGWWKLNFPEFVSGAGLQQQKLKPAAA